MLAIDKSITELKSSVDKSIADLKSSVDQISANVAFVASKFQDFAMHLDIVKGKMEEIEIQSTSDHREVTKHVLKSSARTLRIQNLPMQKDEVIYTVVADVLIPIRKTSHQEIIPEIDLAY